MCKYVCLIWFAVGAGATAARAQNMAIALHPGDTLTIRGSQLDRVKTVVRFAGTAGATTLSSVSADGQTATVIVPKDARPGDVSIVTNQTEVGKLTIFIAPVEDATAHALNNFFNQLSQNQLAYLMALAALGVLTMSIIQTIKNLIPQIRRTYQRRFTRQWLLTHAEEAEKMLGKLTATEKNAPTARSLHKNYFEGKRDETKPKKSPAEVIRDKAETQLILLAADNDTNALYDSETDDFCKQLSAVAQLVVDFPRQYQELFTVMAANADAEDYRWLIEHGGLGSGRVQAAPPSALTPDELQALLSAKQRVRQLVVQAMNAFQMDIAWRWGLGMRVASFAVSLTIALLAIGKSGTQPDLLATLISALIAAFLAPVARDMVVALQKLRG